VLVSIYHDLLKRIQHADYEFSRAAASVHGTEARDFAVALRAMQ